MSPRNPVTGYPIVVSDVCHYCGNDADTFNDIKAGTRIFHHHCYLEYSGAGVDANDDYEIED